VRRLSASTLVLALAVGCGAADAAPRKPKPIRIAVPGPLALTPDGGALVVGDRQLRRVVRVDLRTRRRTIVASGFPDAVVGLGYDDTNRLYVASLDRVYRLDGKRKIVVAGTGTRGHTGDGGPATAAQLAGATGIDVDHDERIAIAEYDNWIRVVEADGTIRTVAGNGGTGRAGDGGPATAALLGHPHDVVWRRDGLVIADSHNGVLRRVDAAGTITTFAEVGVPIDVAGAPGDALYVTDARGWVARVAPDGAVARLAFLATPIGVVGDYNGNVYVAQLNARRIMRVSRAGRVTVFVPRS
jgi:DNA-binding beta-propeller fold protein YncE